MSLPAPEPEPTSKGPWTIFGAMLLIVVAVAQMLFGVLAIAGLEQLQDNVREIESDPRFGTLYLSLTGWGVLLLGVGLLELYAGLRLYRRAKRSRLVALAATLPGLVLSFYSLALFRFAAVVTAVALLLLLYVLSYRVTGD